MRTLRFMLDMFAWLRRATMLAVVVLTVCGLALKSVFHGVAFIDTIWSLAWALGISAVTEFVLKITYALKYGKEQIRRSNRPLQPGSRMSQDEWETSLLLSSHSVLCAAVAGILTIVSFRKFEVEVLVLLAIAATLLTWVMWRIHRRENAK